MRERLYALLGVAGPIVVYISIMVSIMLSPWFSWGGNALSDLGHAVRSEVASIYNLGLLIGAFLIIIYNLKILRHIVKYTGISLTASAFLLQLVALFDEVYGDLHGIVSVLFFVSIGITSIKYAFEKRDKITIIAIITAFSSWIFYGAGVYRTGIAVPEAISTVAVSTWIICSAVRTYRER